MKVTPLLSLGLSAVLGIGAVFLGRYYMTADNNDAAAQPQIFFCQIEPIIACSHHTQAFAAGLADLICIEQQAT